MTRLTLFNRYQEKNIQERRSRLRPFEKASGTASRRFPSQKKPCLYCIWPLTLVYGLYHNKYSITKPKPCAKMFFLSITMEVGIIMPNEQNVPKKSISKQVVFL
jgi:hypothetical protein